MTDELAEELLLQIVVLEEVIAARWPRSILLRCAPAPGLARARRPRRGRHVHREAYRVARDWMAGEAAMTGAGQEALYLLHFDRPYKHARHYTGWTGSSESLTARLARHAAGTAPGSWRTLTRPGSPGELARTREGPRARERQLKRQGGASRHCPMCGVKPRPAAAGHQANASARRHPRPGRAALGPWRRTNGPAARMAVAS